MKKAILAKLVIDKQQTKQNFQKTGFTNYKKFSGIPELGYLEKQLCVRI